MSNNNVIVKSKGVQGWFERFTARDLWKGLLVVIVASILAGAEGLINTRSTGSTTAAITTASYTSAAYSGFELLIIWVLSTLLFHGLSRLMKGKGSLRRFFTMNGLAFLPILVQGLLSVIDVALFSPIGASPIANQPLLTVLMSELNLLNLFSLGLTVVAVSTNYGLSRKRAVLGVIVPVIILLVLGLVGLPINRTGSTIFRGLGGFGIGRGGFTPPGG
jgi:hypothetical protein